MTLAVAPPRVAFGTPRSAVPEHDRSRAVLFFRDHALEVAVVQRMILDVDGEPLVRRIEARSLRHRPAFERAVELETEVVMQAAGGVLLHDEPQPCAALRRHAALRLRSLAEIAFAMVALETHDRGHSAAESVPASLRCVSPCPAYPRRRATVNFAILGGIVCQPRKLSKEDSARPARRCRLFAAQARY